MNCYLNEKQPQANIRLGEIRRITNDSFKAKMADGFAAVAKRMEEDR
ncbi:hypothetical protein ACK35S_19060 [Aeromonas veronii]